VPLEGTYSELHQRLNAFSELSDAKGNPLLARPIFNTQPGKTGETSVVLSSPGSLAGGVSVNSSLQLWGVQAVGVVRTECQWGDDCWGCEIDLPIGFRMLYLNEDINITSSSGTTLAKSTIVSDMFKGTNEFRGGVFGMRIESRMDRWTLFLEPKISIGATNQAALIEGETIAGTKITPGGLLAVASNGGFYNRDRFTYLPEGTAKLVWRCCPWMHIQAGYDITYWPNVQRPGNEINRAVDLRQVPSSSSFVPGLTGNSPSFVFNTSTFLMQDISLGVVFTY
jgi:hypothetical protein